MSKAKIGIIGGSGLYDIEGVNVIEEMSVKTPWGMPSDKIKITEIDGIVTAFQRQESNPRHLLATIFGLINSLILLTFPFFYYSLFILFSIYCFKRTFFFIFNFEHYIKV